MTQPNLDYQARTGLRPALAIESFQRALRIGDLVIIALVILFTHLARFGAEDASIVTIHHGALSSYTMLGIAIVITWWALLAALKSYREHLLGYGSDEYHRVFQATITEFGGLALLSYLAGLQLSRGYFLVALPGGLVALHLAIRHPHKVRRLCLTSSFAKFLAASDYPQGQSRTALDKMIALFEQDYPKYMRQFLQLQLLNTPDGEEIIASVLPDMVKNGAPAALKAALDALSLADARPFLRQIRQPVLLVYGGKDSITPPRMGEYLEQHLPFAELQIIEKAAHAPFLSHAAEFSGLLKRFFG